MSRVYHNRSFKLLIPQVNIHNHDMCHDTIGYDVIESESNLIEIEFDVTDNESRPNRFESQPDWDYGIL